MLPRPPPSTLFPYTTLFRSVCIGNFAPYFRGAGSRIQKIADIRNLAGKLAIRIRVHRDERGLADRSEEHTSELQSQFHLVCRLLLEKKKRMSVQISRTGGGS